MITSARLIFGFSGVPGGTVFKVRDDADGTEAVKPTSTWRWNNANTDGGALGFLTPGVSITITPSFPTSGGLTAGKIDDWKWLTGTGTLLSPDEISLGNRTTDPDGLTDDLIIRRAGGGG